MYYGGCSTSNLLHLLERALLHTIAATEAAAAAETEKPVQHPPRTAWVLEAAKAEKQEKASVF